MNVEISSHLESTRDLLAGSLRIHPSDPAPAVPSSLMADLTSSARAMSSSKAETSNLFDRLLEFCSKPGFGIAAAAAVIAFVAFPSLMEPGETKETFRGAPSVLTNAESIQIVLVGGPRELRTSLEASPDFSGLLVSSVNDAEAASLLTGARVVVDFASSELIAVDAADTERYRAALPGDTGELSLAIATAMTRLD